jgi:hypothetical protein
MLIIDHYDIMKMQGCKGARVSRHSEHAKYESTRVREYESTRVIN